MSTLPSTRSILAAKQLIEARALWMLVRAVLVVERVNPGPVPEFFFFSNSPCESRPKEYKKKEEKRQRYHESFFTICRNGTQAAKPDLLSNKRNTRNMTPESSINSCIKIECYDVKVKK